MSDNDLSSTEKENTTKTDAAATGEIPPEVFDSNIWFDDRLKGLNYFKRKRSKQAIIRS